MSTKVGLGGSDFSSFCTTEVLGSVATDNVSACGMQANRSRFQLFQYFVSDIEGIFFNQVFTIHFKFDFDEGR